MFLTAIRNTCLTFPRSAINANFASMALHLPIEHVNAVPTAVNLLQEGHVIALPTDTVYGLACSAVNLNAINNLFRIKVRNGSKPLAICVGRVSDVQRWAVVDHLPNGLLKSLLPGPVTLVLRCANKLDDSLSFLGKVGLRIPNKTFLINVCNEFNLPIALTSANLSSEPSSVKIGEFVPLWNKLGGVFDGGPLGVGDSNRGASTVIDLSESGSYKITRKGIAESANIEILQNIKLATNKKETLVKNSIIRQLSDSVKEVQLYHSGDTISSDSLQMNEAEGALCVAIEALLLHGVKYSLVHRARRVIADLDEQPEPSFWAPLLIISHKQNITQITNLTQVTTEIGQCRAWIRIALNECLLSSYFSTMCQDSSVLKPYYNTYALVRDSELLEVAQKLIEGLETLAELSLPFNSSLLNSWQLQSLILAGIWSPTLRSCPIAAGVDVAQSLQTTSSANSETTSLSSAVSFNSHSSGIPVLLTFNEDEALRIILAKHSSEQSVNINTKTQEEKVNNSIFSEVEPNGAEFENVTLLPETNLGNSLSRRSGWSFSEVPETSDESLKQSINNNSNVELPKSPECSYHALIESYNLLGGNYVKTPDLKEVWQYFQNSKSTAASPQMDTVPKKLPNIDEVKMEQFTLKTNISKISREEGLDHQSYQCADCKEDLGLTPIPKTCGFTAKYYCDNCMSQELICVPARIIHNWDFKTYGVSKKALHYVNEIKELPLIDLKVLNPHIYMVSDEMTKLQTLRIQLNFLRDYLYTCREPVIEELQNQINGKEYMYEHVHQYSIMDLSQIRNGTLSQQLQKVVQFGVDHVHNCWLCSQKGFICEICKKLKVLYPFDVDNVYRCNVCNAIYHNGCLNSTKPCPKCDRRKKREDLPLLGATIE
ncbi:hypothetical protein FQA39_LY06463 [Lamprigera yunnana]|nr:hypothetical protein FQA39_LY06463 [Lamprigera yunnana]